MGEDRVVLGITASGREENGVDYPGLTRDGMPILNILIYSFFKRIPSGFKYFSISI